MSSLCFLSYAFNSKTIMIEIKSFIILLTANNCGCSVDISLESQLSKIISLYFLYFQTTVFLQWCLCLHTFFVFHKIDIYIKPENNSGKETKISTFVVLAFVLLKIDNCWKGKRWDTPLFTYVWRDNNEFETLVNIRI